LKSSLSFPLMAGLVNVRGVAFMEAIVPPAYPMDDIEAMGEEGADLFRELRDPQQGRELIVEQNIFIESLLAEGPVTRDLGHEEMEVYREPFRNPEDRKPILMWPRELPIEGEPERNVEAVERVGEWLKTSPTPKLLLYARPGAIVPPEAAGWMREHYHNLQTRFVGPGRHYIQEDHPEIIARNLAGWYLEEVR